MSDQIRAKIISVLIVSGFIIAILSAIEPHSTLLSELCGFFADGCKDTAKFSIFHINLSFWGIGFFTCLIILNFISRSWIFWFVMCGFGVELTFAKIMINEKFLCFFCFLNLVVMMLLFLFNIKKSHLWQTLAIVLIFFTISDFIIAGKTTAIIANNLQKKETIVAVIDGKKITDNKLETLLAGQLYTIRQKIYNIKKKKLLEIIQETLFKKEAAKKGISSKALEKQILSGVAKITDEDVEKYYQENQNRFKNVKESKEELKKRIQKFLQQTTEFKKKDAFLKSLMTKHNTVITLPSPMYPVVNVSIDQSPVWGPLDSPVTIVEFSDYMCSACKNGHNTEVKQIKKLYKGKIKWIFKDFPLERHKGAKELANAARCAGEQGKFWDYQDFIFSSNQYPDIREQRRYAEYSGLNLNKFDDCIKTKKYIPMIEKDIKDGQNVGVSYTPTFIINGQLISGMPTIEKFKKLIDDELLIQ